MPFYSKFVLILALVWIQSNSCQTKEFCQTFVNNDNEIEFVFRVVDYFDYKSQSYLFIDDNYWYLDFDQDYMDLHLWNRTSKRPHQWFGDKYSLGLCLWRPFQGYCAIGLIDKNLTSIDFRRKIGGETYKGYEKVVTHPIEFRPGFRPNIAFVVNDGKHENLVWFVEQHTRKGGVPYNNYNGNYLEGELYEFDDNLQSKPVDNQKLKDEVLPYAIGQMDPHLQFIGLYRQILRRSPKRAEEYGIIILVKDHKVIKYCWTHDKQLNTSCHRESLKTLIDCSAYTKEEVDIRYLPFDPTINDQVQFKLDDVFFGFWFKMMIILAVILISIRILANYRKKDKEADKQYKLNLVFAEDFQKKLLKV